MEIIIDFYIYFVLYISYVFYNRFIGYESSKWVKGYGVPVSKLNYISNLLKFVLSVRAL